MKENTIKLNETSFFKAINRDRLLEFTKAALMGLLPFLLSAGKIFGAISPFSVAMVASAPAKYLLTAILGHALGNIIFFEKGGVYYIFSGIIAFAVRVTLSRLTKKQLTPLTLSLVGFGSAAIPAFFNLMISSNGLIDTVLIFIEVMLTGCFSYFYAVCANAFFKKRTSSLFTYVENGSLCVLFITVITALSSFSPYKLNIGVILGTLAVFLMTTRFGVIGGSVSSIAVSIALIIFSTEMVPFCGMLIVSAFIAGIFSPLKKIAQMFIFIFISTFCMFIFGAPIFLSYRLIDVFVASAIFVLIPERLIAFLEAGKPSLSKEANPRLMQESVAMRLKFAASTISDLKKELQNVAVRFSEIDKNNVSTVLDSASSIACYNCTKKLACWDDNYSDTVDALNPVISVLKGCGEVNESNIPTYFKERCCKLQKLCSAINKSYGAYLSKQTSKSHLNETRQIVFEQLQSISDMLYGAGDDFQNVSGYNEELSRKAFAAFSAIENEKPDKVSCYVDKSGRTTLEIYTKSAIKNSDKNLCIELSEATGKIFDLPSVSTVEGTTRLCFFETATYTADFSVQQICCGDNKVCGDSYLKFYDEKGYVYLILSDGMGNGKRAAVDSVMACSLFIKLIKAGFGLEASLKLINSSLQVKSTDESLATIDIARIDLYTGKAEIIKAGAPSSFIYKKNSVERISLSSLPIGIMSEIKTDKEETILTAGDILVMVSDGATVKGDNYILEEIRRNSRKTASEISSIICTEAKRRCEGAYSDDITVMVAKMSRGI